MMELEIDREVKCISFALEKESHNFIAEKLTKLFATRERLGRALKILGT